jgi:hypothetical protein
MATLAYATPGYSSGGYGGGYLSNGGGGGGGTTTASGLDLCGVLNYLAGVVSGPMLGPSLAASSAWNAINGHGAKAAQSPTESMIGALNAKAGTVGQDINLVCNTLAGTVGLEAALALRIYAGLS